MSNGPWQRADHFVRLLLPGFTVLALIVLGALPWPLPFISGIAPPFGLIAVVFWALRRPGIFSPLGMFLLGLLQDFLAGHPLGVCAFAFVAVHLLCGDRIRQLVGGSFSLAWLVLSGAMLATLLLQAGVFVLFHGLMVPFEPLILQFAVIVGSYPLAVSAFLAPVAEVLPRVEELA